LNGFLTDAVAEVMEAGTTDAAAFHDFDLGDFWGVDWEDPFDAFAVADFADGEGLADALAFTGDDDACEELDAFFAAFEDSGVDLDGVTDAEVGDVGLHLFALNLFKLVHKKVVRRKGLGSARDLEAMHASVPTGPGGRVELSVVAGGRNGNFPLVGRE
jgi:hypothetical protein